PQVRLQPGGRLPDAAGGVDAGHDPGDGAGRAHLPPPAGVAVDDLRVEGGRVLLDHQVAQGVDPGGDVVGRAAVGRPALRGAQQQEGAPLLAGDAGRAHDLVHLRLADVAVPGEHHQVEQVDQVEGEEAGVVQLAAGVVRHVQGVAVVVLPGAPRDLE